MHMHVNMYVHIACACACACACPCSRVTIACASTHGAALRVPGTSLTKCSSMRSARRHGLSSRSNLQPCVTHPVPAACSLTILIVALCTPAAAPIYLLYPGADRVHPARGVERPTRVGRRLRRPPGRSLRDAAHRARRACRRAPRQQPPRHDRAVPRPARTGRRAARRAAPHQGADRGPSLPQACTVSCGPGCRPMSLGCSPEAAVPCTPGGSPVLYYPGAAAAAATVAPSGGQRQGGGRTRLGARVMAGLLRCQLEGGCPLHPGRAAPRRAPHRREATHGARGRVARRRRAVVQTARRGGAACNPTHPRLQPHVIKSVTRAL